MYCCIIEQSLDLTELEPRAATCHCSTRLVELLALEQKVPFVASRPTRFRPFTQYSQQALAAVHQLSLSTVRGAPHCFCFCLQTRWSSSTSTRSPIAHNFVCCCCCRCRTVSHDRLLPWNLNSYFSQPAEQIRGMLLTR